MYKVYVAKDGKIEKDELEITRILKFNLEHRTTQPKSMCYNVCFVVRLYYPRLT